MSDAWPPPWMLWMQALRDRGPRNGRALCALLVLASYMDDDGEAWPGMRTWAKGARMAINTLTKYRDAAVADGWLTQARSSAAANAHMRYRCRIPPETAKSVSPMSDTAVSTIPDTRVSAMSDTAVSSSAPECVNQGGQVCQLPPSSVSPRLTLNSELITSESARSGVGAPDALTRKEPRGPFDAVIDRLAAQKRANA